MNEERNNVAIGKDGVISERNSPVKVVVLKSDEMSEMNAVVTQNTMPTTPNPLTT
jgi:acetate kinase